MKTTTTPFGKSAALAAACLLAGCVYYESPRHGHYQPGPPPAVATPVPVQVVPAEVSSFEAPLAPYGVWVDVAGYGRCWRPAGVAVSWRPYTVGYWAYTDYGWTWVSEEPFGDITCHYGAWTFASSFGWVWVPGTTWGPAWVCWRSGGGYVGWAPMPPSMVVRGRIVVTDAAVQRLPAASFTFVEERHIAARHVQQRIVAPQQNAAIISRTTNVTNITVVQNRVVNNSLSVTQVQKATGRPVTAVPTHVVNTPQQVKEVHDRGHVAIFQPAPGPRGHDGRPQDSARGREKEKPGRGNARD